VVSKENYLPPKDIKVIDSK